MQKSTKGKHPHHHENYDLHGDIEKIKAALFGAVHNAKGKAGDKFAKYWDDTKERSANLHENVANYTSEKPLQTLGVAFLAGILVGYIIRK